MHNLATDLARVMEELAERWERIAAEQGVRQFTGNDHRLFANELRATLTAWNTRAASGGDSASLEKHSDGMLPDELVTHSKEWYRLCERRFSVERMTISGELAEAIVACISRLNEPFGNSEQLASLEQRARSLLPDGWTHDCQGKQDYDADLLALSCRYYPANYQRNGKAAVSAAVVWGEGDERLFHATLEAETESQVKAMAESWAAEKIVAIRAALANQQGVGDDLLFDGYSVFKALSADAGRRTSAENVSDVLDAIVRLRRATQPAGDVGSGNG